MRLGGTVLVVGVVSLVAHQLLAAGMCLFGGGILLMQGYSGRQK